MSGPPIIERTLKSRRRILIGKTCAIIGRVADLSKQAAIALSLLGQRAARCTRATRGEI